MKRFFSKEPNGQIKLRSKLWSITYTFLVAAFILAAVPSAEAQRPRVPTPVNGKFSDISVDGDRLKILTTSRGGQPGKVRIKLEADPTWWRMLRVFDSKGRAHYVEQQDGRYLGNAWISINSQELGDSFKIEFWKAKFLGIHTYINSEVYRKRDFDGRIVTFVWREGLEGPESDVDPVTGGDTPAATPIDESVNIEGKYVTIRSSNNGRAGYATINFGTNLDWWTAIIIRDRFGKVIEVGKSNGRNYPINIRSLPSEVTFEFWTAKFLGVHTHMASKKFIRDRLDGRTVNIYWPK